MKELLPDQNIVAKAKRQSFCLGDINRRDSFVQRRSIHVNCRSNWQDKSSDSLVHVIVNFQRRHCKGQGGGTRKEKVTSVFFFSGFISTKICFLLSSFDRNIENSSP